MDESRIPPLLTVADAVVGTAVDRLSAAIARLVVKAPADLFPLIDDLFRARDGLWELRDLFQLDCIRLERLWAKMYDKTHLECLLEYHRKKLRTIRNTPKPFGGES